MGRDFCARDFLLGVAFNALQAINITAKDKAYGTTFTAGAPCASNAVHVVFGVLGDVVVENGFDIIDVESTSGDVGGDEQVKFPFTESFGGALASLLADVTV